MKTFKTIIALAAFGLMSINTMADSTDHKVVKKVKNDNDCCSIATNLKEYSFDAQDSFNWESEIRKSLKTKFAYTINVYNTNGELVISKDVPNLEFVTDLELKRIISKSDFITEDNGTAVYLLNN
jgi:hypothetical protein